MRNERVKDFSPELACVLAGFKDYAGRDAGCNLPACQTIPPTLFFWLLINVN